MKQFLLSLLAPIAIGGMFVSAFAQPEISKKNNAEVSDKWVITPVSTMKGVFGRLNINFPADVYWDISIYQQADNKNINNFSSTISAKSKSYNIAPGEYRIVLYGVPVENVPIQKGHETRLKAGFLNVVSEGVWALFNESKEKYIHTYDKPLKFLVPVGNYQLKLAGQFYPVIIKDGETVEDYSPVEIKDKTPVEIKKDEAPGQVNTEIIETDKWVITPTSESEEGRIVTKFPISGMTLNIYHWLRIYRPGESASVFYCRPDGPDHCPETYSLAEGLYDVHFGVAGEAKTNNPIIVSNVPVKKGYETRLKVGYLKHKFKGIYKVFDESMQENYLSYNFQLSPPPIPLPVGIYTIHMPNAGNFKVQIKDGIKTEQAPEDFSKKFRWTITPILKIGATPASLKGGRIISQFPGSDTLKFILHIRQPDGTGYKDVTLDTLEYYDTKPGIYTADLNNDRIEFPVEQGKQTKLRYGFMKLGAGTWTLKDLVSGKVFNYGIHAGIHKRALPIGLYVYKHSDNKYYLLKINEGENLILVMTY